MSHRALSVGGAFSERFHPAVATVSRFVDDAAGNGLHEARSGTVVDGYGLGARRSGSVDSSVARSLHIAPAGTTTTTSRRRGTSARAFSISMFRPPSVASLVESRRARTHARAPRFQIKVRPNNNLAPRNKHQTGERQRKTDAKLTHAADPRALTSIITTDHNAPCLRQQPTVTAKIQTSNGRHPFSTIPIGQIGRRTYFTIPTFYKPLDSTRALLVCFLQL